MIDAAQRIALREWRWIRRDRKQVLLVAIAPLVFVAILGLVYSPRKVLHVPVLIVDQDHSTLSRALARAILADETYSLGGYADSSDEFPRWVDQDRAHVCFVFPHNFERDLRARRGGKVQVVVDASNMLSGSVEVTHAATLLGTFAVGVETLMIEAKGGVTGTVALNHALPIQIGTRAWFNPGFTSNYLNFLMIGILTIPVQLAGLLVSIGSGVSEYGERRSAISCVTRNPWSIIAGKVTAYVAIIYPVCMAVVCTPCLFFGAPMAGSLLTVALVTLWFTAMLVTFSYALSCILADPLFATEICALITLPNFLLSGFTWPIFAMPKVLWPFAYGLPMYSFSFMYRKLSVMGATASDCLPQMAVLCLWTLLALGLARYGTYRILKNGSEAEGSHA